MRIATAATGYAPSTTVVVIVVGFLLVVAVIGWLVVNRRHPEAMAWHEDHGTRTTSERLYEGADRPAGPDASAMDPDADDRIHGR